MDGTDGLEGLDEIVGEFLVESHENLDQLDQDLVLLEGDPSSGELLSSVFRTLHTIKGTSGFLAFGTLESVTHVGESLLSRLRDGQLTLTPELTTALLEMVDAVRALLARIEETGAEGGDDYAGLVARLNALLDADAATEDDSDSKAGKPAPRLGDVLLSRGVVSSDDLEIALAEQRLGDKRQLGQILVAQGTPVDAVANAIQEQNDLRRSVAEGSIRVDVALLDSLMNLVGELVLTRNQMLQRVAARDDVELQRTTHRLNLIAGELQEGVMKTRMQPVDNVWSKLPRVVRDLSVTLGKSVDLLMEGRDTELDRTVLEAVRDPLTHLVRNAVDHGIEDADTRRAAGKPVSGTLTLRAFHEGGQVNIEIADDGAGIDPARLRAKAVAEGMLTAESAETMSDREAVHLIFSAGFSTASAVTNVSGRGVGMDVVKSNIEKIGGSIDLASEPGAGTTVRIRIPLTLAIVPALVVSAAERRYAIPQVNLRELVRVEPDQERGGVEYVHGTPVYRLRGQLLPLVDLREQLALPGRGGGTAYIAVLQADSRLFGLVVDAVLDTEEIVVKPLGRQLHGIPLYAGAAIMGDGSIALILDCVALARTAGLTVESGVVDDRPQPDAHVDERRALLVVGLADGRRAGIPQVAVDRLEEIAASRVERVAGSEVLQYRGEILPLVRLDRALDGGAPDPAQTLSVVVCRGAGRRVGLVVTDILDIVDDELSVRSDLGTGGHDGSAVVSGRVTELVDVERAIRAALPDLQIPVVVA